MQFIVTLSQVTRMDGDKVLYDRNWRAPDTVAEVIEAVSNLTVAIYMIRNYSYEVRSKNGQGDIILTTNIAGNSPVPCSP